MKYKKFQLCGSGLTGAWQVRGSDDAIKDVYLEVIEVEALNEARVLIKELINSIEYLQQPDVSAYHKAAMPDSILKRSKKFLKGDV